MKKKKGKKDNLKLTKFERLRYVYRSDKFLRDFEELERLDDDEELFRIKWGIDMPFLLPPKEFKEYEQQYSKNLSPLFENHPVSILSTKNVKLKEKPKLTSKGWKIVNDEIDFTPLLKDGRFIDLRIDLTADKGEVAKGINFFYEFFGKYVNKPKGRKSKQSYDPLEIFDLMKQDGMTLQKITNDKTKIPGSPSNPPKNLNDIDRRRLISAYEGIRSVYNKARETIRQIEEAAKQN
ncbi:MAG: hypothetical protein HZA16_07310 [Nitrospirae bacterium]|nr:hypothetical protein [Nitrospirota bacterium]